MRDDFKQNHHSLRDFYSQNTNQHLNHLRIKVYDTSEKVKHPKVHSYKS